MDKKYTYELWKAPLSVQKATGVRITGDRLNDVQEGTYPKPVFDFNERRDACRGDEEDVRGWAPWQRRTDPRRHVAEAVSYRSGCRGPERDWEW